MKQIWLFCFSILLFTQAAHADEPCDDLWYSRNFYFDQAGYCFGSNLGKAVFDNSDCKSKNVNLAKSILQRIDKIKETEAGNSCKVKTNKARRLNIKNFEMRKTLIEQPINHGFESSCFGYKGKLRVALYAARSTNSKIIGYVNLDDNVYSAFDEADSNDWWFATATHNDTNISSIGWTNQTIFNQCRAVAG